MICVGVRCNNNFAVRKEFPAQFLGKPVRLLGRNIILGRKGMNEMIIFPAVLGLRLVPNLCGIGKLLRIIFIIVKHY